ncbi:MAG: glycosyltransferase family 9 protein [Candidatus Acididesulfobacter diazotrophicus]|uniref:Glycosyltransferase family 9 protein n=1 Tax=Candidatus Acididesulfobacter diazotrophicus TaxID=2597226 RepID=A0A519BKG3_9DELT|nr:MAG: glycosyltransferase family 9 protein [Candidatus Acididesulfobacter diazotrophicus]
MYNYIKKYKFPVYNVRKKKWKFLLFFIDFFLYIFIKKTKNNNFYSSNLSHSKSVKKILLCNGAHIGDVLISANVIPLLQHNNPNIEIGFLGGSWSVNALNEYDNIKHVHIVDHWMLNRSNLSIFKKIKQYYNTRKKVIKEIKNIGYDAAVDMYYFMPNNAMLIWQAGIPMRISYDSAGFSSFLTDVVKWEEKKQHIVNYNLTLFKKLSFNLPERITAYNKLFISSQDINNIKIILDNFNINFGDYIVVHPGTGLKAKKWIFAKWISLIQRLIEKKENIVITGYGKNECIETAEIASKVRGHVINLCDNISFQDFVALVSKAKAIISVDSVASHIGAMTNIPTVCIFSGIPNYFFWSPIGEKTKVIHLDIPCSPCYKREGCEKMDCLNNINVNLVIDTLYNIL